MGEGRDSYEGDRQARIERDLTMMLSLANHDLQAPLRTLRSFVELAAEEHPSPFLEEAVAIAARMQTLLRAVLTYGRLHRHRLRLRAVPLAEAVAAGLDRVGLELDEREARVEIADPLPRVIADRALLGMSLEAVLDNATRYRAPDRSPSLRIDATVVGDRVRLNITDNGIGLPPEHRARCFDAGTRFSSNGAPPGNGFGLAVTARACALQGGGCGIDDSPTGVGLRVWIELPAAPDGDVGDPPTEV